MQSAVNAFKRTASLSMTIFFLRYRAAMNRTHAKWATSVALQPHVDATLVEVVPARQPPNLVVVFKFHQANGAAGAVTALTGWA